MQEWLQRFSGGQVLVVVAGRGNDGGEVYVPGNAMDPVEVSQHMRKLGRLLTATCVRSSVTAWGKPCLLQCYDGGAKR